MTETLEVLIAKSFYYKVLFVNIYSYQQVAANGVGIWL